MSGWHELQLNLLCFHGVLNEAVSELDVLGSLVEHVGFLASVIDDLLSTLSITCSASLLLNSASN
jgi:hypothetical protein